MPEGKFERICLPIALDFTPFILWFPTCQLIAYMSSCEALAHVNIQDVLIGAGHAFEAFEIFDIQFFRATFYLVSAGVIFSAA